MTYESITSRHLILILVVLALALAAPAAAQGTGPRVVQPGETIEVGSEPLVLDLVNLRSADTFNAVTELRHYRDDNPKKQIVRVIGVPNDGYFTINARTLDGKYGRYFAFSKEDGLMQQSSIIFAPAPEVTATVTETAATVTETPTETQPPHETTAMPTRAPLPGLIVVAALGICGLIVAAGRRQG